MQIHIGSKHLVADVAVALDVSGREHLVVVAKATWSIPEPGQRPRPLKPEPLVMSDQFYGEPGESALRYGSDFARFKPQCDVIFDACAHAPGGKPVKQMEVSVQVGSLKKTVRVHGPRKWQRMLGVTRMGETEPFTRMPLHYGYAFGGTRWYEKDEQTLAEACLHNASGVGYAGSKTVSQMHGAPAPSLEDPKKAVSKPDGSYRPCALSPLARHWSPRRELGGTYDEKWREEVFPLLPADFDEAYHQVAPVDQRVGYLVGGEVVRLKGVLLTQADLAFRLPALSLHVEVQRTDDSFEQPIALSDTLFFEPEQQRFSVVWRTAVRMRRRVQEFKAVGLHPHRARPLSGGHNLGACVGCNEPMQPSFSDEAQEEDA
jgi:hypothetical protein